MISVPRARRWVPLLGLVLGVPRFLAAQEPTGTVLVRVRADSVPAGNAVIRSGRVGALTSAAGRASLVLPVGARIIWVTLIGFHPESLSVTVLPDTSLTFDIALHRPTEELEEIRVSATRTERRIDDEPERVEVLSGGDIAEKTQMRPADLVKVLTEMVGVRMQPSGGALGSTRLRIHGLRGQYTAILADGLPLYGGMPTGFGILQLTPVDIQQAEVIKGTATALYGPSAVGGLLNLISKRPDRNVEELELNQTNRGGSDAILWSAHRLSPTVGLTLTTTADHQTATDVNGDGWADLPGFTRLALRPRLFWDAPNGDGLFLTAGVFGEDRTGGFVGDNGASLYRETQDTRRIDVGFTARRMQGTAGRFALRFSAVHQWTDHQFGTVPERDQRTTLFAELTYAITRGATALILGAAWQQDALREQDVTGFDYTHRVPGLFGQVTTALASWLSGSASGRCDVHNVYGTFCSPRVSVLVRPTHGLSARASAGAGFYGPTPFTDESEVLGLHALVPTRLRAERARTASVDLSWRQGEVQLGGTLAGSQLSDPTALEPATGVVDKVHLVNRDGPTVIYSGELFAVVGEAPFVATAFYGYLEGTELDPASRWRRSIPGGKPSGTIRRGTPAGPTRSRNSW